MVVEKVGRERASELYQVKTRPYSLSCSLVQLAHAANPYKRKSGYNFDNWTRGWGSWEAARETELAPYLFVIDGPLQGVFSYKSVNVARFCLTVPVDPAHCLSVVTRVPGYVHDYHPREERCCHGDLGCGNCGE